MDRNTLPMDVQLVRTFGAEHDRLRLDLALARLFPDFSRSFVSKLIDSGRVRIDGVTAEKSSLRVAAGQQAALTIPPPTPSEAVPQELPLTILYEDSNLVAVDKPPGLVVHPAAGHPDHTLVNALLFHVTNLSAVGGVFRPGVVHRLDKDTSGVMIIAKNDATHRALAAAWRYVRKEYLAIVYGKPKRERGIIDAPIGRDPRNRKRMAVVRGGRSAATDYEVLESLRYASLLRCTLRSGRTHQIRVHLKHLGHPIIGDPLYAGPQWRGIPDKRLRSVLASFPRQALHSWRITVPEHGAFEAPMPEDMRELLQALRG